MALSDPDRLTAARELARRIFPSDVTANLNLDDLKAAIGGIDDVFDMQPNDPALSNSLTLKQNFLALLPEPFKSTATSQQKAFALMVWAMKEVGVI
jgi:hypothetical protein